MSQPKVKWTTDDRGFMWTARVGHLYLAVEDNGADGEERSVNWWIATDDDDKCDERALEAGNARNPGPAKKAALEATLRIVDKMLASLGMPDALQREMRGDS